MSKPTTKEPVFSPEDFAYIIGSLMDKSAAARLRGNDELADYANQLIKQAWQLAIKEPEPNQAR